MSSSNIVLFQTGDKSRDPKTGTYYNPWESHIWLCLQQIRTWNPNINIWMITDDHQVPSHENFEKFNVRREYIDNLVPKFDIESIPYFSTSINPSERSCGLRPFYIESLIKREKLTNIFTFDNDVLIYFDVERIGNILKSLYITSALTPDSADRLVLGMCYINNIEMYSKITDSLWELMNNEKGRNLLDMGLWNLVYKEKGKSYIDVLPTWIDGLFSDNNDKIGGIFDPSSIGQYLLGCDNGNPPGTLFHDHYIHNRLRENNYSFEINFDEQNRKFVTVKNIQNNFKYKILSIHVHNKKLKLLM